MEESFEWDAEELHRMLDRILESEYAEEVRAILYHHYQRALAQRHAAPPDALDRPD